MPPDERQGRLLRWLTKGVLPYAYLGGTESSSGDRHADSPTSRLYVYDRNIGRYLAKFAGAPLLTEPATSDNLAMFVNPLTEALDYQPWNREDGDLAASFDSVTVFKSSTDSGRRLGSMVNSDQREFVRYERVGFIALCGRHLDEFSCHYAAGHLFIHEGNGRIHILRDYKQALRTMESNPRSWVSLNIAGIDNLQYQATSGPWLSALWSCNPSDIFASDSVGFSSNACIESLLTCRV